MHNYQVLIVFCRPAATDSTEMNAKLLRRFIGSFVVAWAASAAAQPAPAGSATAQGNPVSYASVSEVNGLLSQLENTSKMTQSDLGRLRIEKWKAGADFKKQSLTDVDSIQRNLQNALPEMIGQVRSAPEDVGATFKLYRNLDALYDVLSGVTESAGAFGSKDGYQSLSNDLSAIDSARRQFGDRIQNLASTKETEITNLRTELKTAQAALAAAPPKKVVVDDTEPTPAKKTVKKKKPTKKPSSETTKTPTPAPQQSATPQQ